VAVSDLGQRERLRALILALADARTPTEHDRAYEAAQDALATLLRELDQLREAVRDAHVSFPDTKWAEAYAALVAYAVTCPCGWSVGSPDEAFTLSLYSSHRCEHYKGSAARWARTPTVVRGSSGRAADAIPCPFCLFVAEWPSELAKHLSDCSGRKGYLA
jgi:hypothetical protein